MLVLQEDREGSGQLKSHAGRAERVGVLCTGPPLPVLGGTLALVPNAGQWPLLRVKACGQ